MAMKPVSRGWSQMIRLGRTIRINRSGQFSIAKEVFGDHDRVIPFWDHDNARIGFMFGNNPMVYRSDDGGFATTLRLPGTVGSSSATVSGTSTARMMKLESLSRFAGEYEVYEYKPTEEDLAREDAFYPNVYIQLRENNESP